VPGGARDEADDAAALMLAKLLRRRRPASWRAGTPGPRSCKAVSAEAMQGDPHLGGCRRTRRNRRGLPRTAPARQLPDIKIVIGLWGTEEGNAARASAYSSSASTKS